MYRRFTAIIKREEDMFVAFCPEIDIASQGYTVEEAKKNLEEAISLFLEHASPEEIKNRHRARHPDVYHQAIQTSEGRV
jgi:predicted RNase H-like HicB family nuclease